jgi:hypothetical protein
MYLDVNYPGSRFEKSRMRFLVGCSAVAFMPSRTVRFPGTTKKKVMGLEQGALSLVSTTDELLDRKVAAPV